MRKNILAFCLVLNSYSLAAAENCGPSFQSTIQRRGTDILVPGKVNGHAIKFGFDLGAADNSLTDRALSLVKLGDPIRTTGENSFGGTDKRKVFKAATVELLGQSFNDVEFTESGYFYDEQNEPDPKEGGLIGAILLQKFDILIDVPHNLVAFFPVDPLCVRTPKWPEVYTALPLNPGSQHRPLFAIMLEDQYLKTVLDTGSPTSKIQAQAAQRLGVSYVDVVGDTIETGTGSDGHRTSRVSHQFDTLAVGNLAPQPQRFQITTWPTSEHVEAILGMDYIDRHSIFISYRSQFVFVKTSSPGLP